MAFFIRIRGKVFGPFEEPQIREMIKRGRFGKVNDISIDGVNWQSAEENETFFPRRQETFAQQSAVQQSAARSDAGIECRQEPSHWYYSMDGKTGLGPYRKSEIFGLVQSGGIRAETIVWQEGGTPEQIARIPEFSACLPSRPGKGVSFDSAGQSFASQGLANQGHVGEIMAELAKPVVDSSVWVFLILCGMILNGFMTLVSYILSGIIFSKLSMLLGIAFFIFGMIPLAGFFTLLGVYWKYSGHTRKFSSNPTPENLKQCLISLSLFWKLCILVPAIFLVLGTIFVVIVFSCGMASFDSKSFSDYGGLPTMNLEQSLKNEISF